MLFLLGIIALVAGLLVFCILWKIFKFIISLAILAGIVLLILVFCAIIGIL